METLCPRLLSHQCALVWLWALAPACADRYTLWGGKPFLGQGEAEWALPALWPSPAGHCWPSNPRPPVPHAEGCYLVYRPFFRQKEFLTERRRLLSSRAGKLLSSKLIISPWPRAPALPLFPGGQVGMAQSHHPFTLGSVPAPASLLPTWPAAPSVSC